MGLNPALLLGSVTGVMTSTSALAVINQAARSPVPALGYAGTYSSVVASFIQARKIAGEQILRFIVRPLNIEMRHRSKLRCADPQPQISEQSIHIAPIAWVNRKCWIHAADQLQTQLFG